jgi:hypothetical protein
VLSDGKIVKGWEYSPQAKVMLLAPQEARIYSKSIPFKVCGDESNQPFLGRAGLDLLGVYVNSETREFIVLREGRQRVPYPKFP